VEGGADGGRLRHEARRRQVLHQGPLHAQQERHQQVRHPAVGGRREHHGHQPGRHGLRGAQGLGHGVTGSLGH